MVGSSSSRSSNAVPWTGGKWLKDCSLVVGIVGVVKPAFWYEFVGVAEVVLGLTGHPLADPHYGLKYLVSLITFRVVPGTAHISRDQMAIDDISLRKCTSC